MVSRHLYCLNINQFKIDAFKFITTTHAPSHEFIGRFSVNVQYKSYRGFVVKFCFFGETFSTTAFWLNIIFILNP